MAQRGDPDLPNHKKKSTIILLLRDEEISIKEATLIFNSDIMKILVDWLHGCILQGDIKYAVFAARKNSSLRGINLLTDDLQPLKRLSGWNIQ